MIDSVVEKIPIIIFSLLSFFNFTLKIYLNKLIKKQTDDPRCISNVSDISKKIKSISLLLTFSKMVQLFLVLLNISSNENLKTKIFDFLNKLNNISMVKYILYVLIFVIYILMLGPLKVIKDNCKDINIGKNTLYVVINWLSISVMIILSILIVVQKFISMKNRNNNDYDDDYDDDIDRSLNFN